MTAAFDRKIYFDAVRNSLFNGTLTHDQVDGQNYILDGWEQYKPGDDLRWLAYFLATALHETASTMQPVAEYGKGSGMEYGKVDPETGQTFYGRGYVQLTWRNNYARADRELHLTGDNRCEYNADLQLGALLAGRTGYLGLVEGWFRSSGNTPNNFAKYFNDTVDDPYEARECVNGDKDIVPSWSNGESIGDLIAEYHAHFLEALNLSWSEAPQPPEPSTGTVQIDLQVTAPEGIEVVVSLNGEVLT
jgi:hypothetical protein